VNYYGLQASATIADDPSSPLTNGRLELGIHKLVNFDNPGLVATGKGAQCPLT
jgi:hypothetical protein